MGFLGLRVLLLWGWPPSIEGCPSGPGYHGRHVDWSVAPLVLCRVGMRD